MLVKASVENKRYFAGRQMRSPYCKIFLSVGGHSLWINEGG